jgi:predicted small lipoprotein YifL
MRANSIVVSLFLAVLLGLTGCGAKGRLTLPEPAAPANAGEKSQ